MKSTFLFSITLLVVLAFSGINQAESAICETGKTQSPIDITSEDLKELAESPSPKFEDALPAEITVDGEKYELQQFHFHTPSEHRINGRHFDIEQHLVFKSKDEKISVVAVFYDSGEKESAFLQPIVEDLPKDFEEEKDIKKVDLSGLLCDVKNITEAYTYSGSLTTPPCTEGVTWYVNQNAQKVSFAQFKKLKDVIGFNSRFTQLRPDDEQPVVNSYKKRSLYSHDYFNKF